MSPLKLFSVMNSNLVKNDERISSERTQTSLMALRFVQFILIGLQLIGELFKMVDSLSIYLVMPVYVYIITILPFIAEPMVACRRGFIGASRYDRVFFLVGMVEFGYLTFTVCRFFPALGYIVPLLLIPAGMLLYYAICVALYAAYLHDIKQDTDDTADD